MTLRTNSSDPKEDFLVSQLFFAGLPRIQKPDAKLRRKAI